MTTTLVVCALVTTGLVVHREFSAPSAQTNQMADQKPVYIENWRSELDKGARLGLANAPIQLIEFADFECAACGDFYQKLKQLRGRYPTQVSVTHMHFPLRGHRFALPAARVVECAGAQGRFEAMYNQLFEGQESLGVKPWSEYATAAGVRDLSAFDACIKKVDPIPQVEQGKELGVRLDVQGTPTLIVNGWKLGRPPTEDELDGMVKKILVGKSPVS